MKLVGIDNIRPGMVVGKSIPNPNGGIELIRKGTTLTSSLVALMQQHQIKSAMITDKPAPRYEHGREAEPGRVLRPGVYVPRHKPVVSSHLRDKAVENLGLLFKEVAIGATDVHASTSTVIKNIDNVVDKMVDSLDEKAVVDIMSLKSYDDYTYYHSISVAVMSTAIGQQMGLSRTDLKRLCKSALLHDIGKTSIPIEIIKKPAKLDSSEFAMVKNHSPAGYHYLAGTVLDSRDYDMLRAVLHHHERVDGSGYPNGFTEENIPLWSRIIAVADVYDALTSNRPYRTPLQPADAVEFLMASIGRDFDYDVVVGFFNKVEIYPIGTKLELSNGKVAVVYNNENSMRPVVRVIPTGEILDLFRDRNCLNIVITRVL